MNVEGILPAVITPFNAVGDVDITALENLIARLYGCTFAGRRVRAWFNPCRCARRHWRRCWPVRRTGRV